MNDYLVNYLVGGEGLQVQTIVISNSNAVVVVGTIDQLFGGGGFVVCNFSQSSSIHVVLSFFVSVVLVSNS